MSSSFFSVIILAIAFILIEITYFFIKRKENKKRTKRYESAINSFETLSQNHKEYLFDLADRTSVFYLSFVLNNVIFLTCGLFGLIFSVATLVLSETSLCSQYSCTPFETFVLSFLAIIFVIVVLYVKPQGHCREYLLAWRKMNAHTQKLLQKDFNRLSKKKVDKLIEKSVKFRSKIERSLNSDEGN